MSPEKIKTYMILKKNMSTYLFEGFSRAAGPPNTIKNIRNQHVHVLIGHDNPSKGCPGPAQKLPQKLFPNILCLGGRFLDLFLGSRGPRFGPPKWRQNLPEIAKQKWTENGTALGWCLGARLGKPWATKSCKLQY